MAGKKRESKAPRASWRGMLRIDLVSFAVDAINAVQSGEGEIHFHQLHQPCHNRIKYQKTCPVHGPVESDEIVLGYEYKKGSYVEVDPEEVAALRTEREKALSIDSFIAAEELDPRYYDGRTYYLLPDGTEAQEPYRVVCAAMAKMNRYGIGQIVMSEREQLVAIRSQDDLLLMSLLHHESAFRAADDLAPTQHKLDAKKMKLAQTLIESSTEAHFDPSRFEDRYQERLDQLIAAKIKGEEIVAPEEDAEPEVINLMDALRKSVAQTRGNKAHRGNGHSTHRSVAKPSGAKRRKSTTARRRKTG